MDANEFVDLVNNHFTYKPGWEFKARVEDIVGTSAIRITYDRVADNSTPNVHEYESKVPVNGVLDILADSITDEATARAVILFLPMFAEIHDAREFARIDGFAPFHPHRGDGEQAYKDAMNLPLIKSLIETTHIFG